ncbi:hypothetical protein niasHT_030387 [Heterodera trifolii]|uniref:Uncharacterized protein n=1 Tax=Heterodera trifolii TaxID=157864 RepID=A0ABD2KT31_9BILA
MSVDQHNNHLNDMGPPPDPVMEVPPPKEIKVLESADDIQHRRTEVLDHYSQFKDFAKTKRDRLEEARQFQYFKRDADELEIWILEKLQTAAVLGHYSQFKDFAKTKRDRLEEARQFQYFKRDADELEIWILEKLQTAAVLDHYSQFKDFAKTKRDRLEEARQFQYFKRDADELEIWILEKLQTAAEESFRDPTNLQAKIQKHHDAFVAEVQSYLDPTNIRGKLQKHGNFEQELRENRNRLDEIKAPGQELIQSGHYANEHIQISPPANSMAWSIILPKLPNMTASLVCVVKMTGHQDNAHVNRIMHELGLSSESIATGLLNRQIGHGSQQQAQEMVSASEEEGADQTDTLSAFGDDEILMTELLDEVPPFDLINQRIVDTIHLQIMARHGVLGGNIRTVDVRVVDEHGNLIYTPPPAAPVPQLLEQFIQDVNSAIGQASIGLMEARVVAAWAHYQLALIQSSELAKDVAGAEALLEQHQEHKGEIEARTDSFKQTAETGQRLLDEDIEEADEIRQCLQNLATSLNNLWEERRILYEQCMDLQLFYKDTEQAESWMTKQELLARRRHLMDRMAQRRELLKESYRLHSFDRDCDEMLGWIQEKLKTAKDQSYLDPTNIRGKLQKHGNFEQELRENRNRLDEIKAPGQELIQSGHYANEHIQELLGMTFKELFKCLCVTASDRSANYRRFVAGGLAGSVTFFFIYPLGFSRTRLAVDMGKDVSPSEFNGLVHYFAKIAKHDGIFGLCRAFVLLMCYIFLYRSFYFGLFDSFKVFVATTADKNCTSGGGSESVPFLAAFCIGQCSAFLAVLFSHPPDTVRRRLMMQPGKNVPDYANAWHCIRHNAILRRFHLPPLVLEPDARRNYDAYLQEANNGDVSTFVNFLVFQQQSSSERMQ